MSTPPGLPPQPEESRLIAPAWHTAMVAAFTFGIAGISAWRGSFAPVGKASGEARLAGYATVFLWEWLTVAFIVWGVRLRGFQMSELIGGSWSGVGAFFRDWGIAILFLLCSTVILGTIQFALHARPNQAVRDILPQTTTEKIVWIFVAATAGFCEETIFRGYFQQQLGRMTRSASVGLVLQALIFGVCHGYQGWKSVITISVFGGLFGLLAARMKSLRPGMLAHFTEDSATGLLLPWALKRMGGA